MKIEAIIDRFHTGGTVVSVTPFGSGHINDTYVSRIRAGGETARLVHQRINSTVFRSPGQVMENIERVTGHIAAKGGKTLTLVPTIDGRSYYRGDEGEYWRTYRFVENATAYDTAQGAGHVTAVGRAFARFQQMLIDLPEPPLHETIAHFGDTRRRFDAFVDVLKDDPRNRAAGAAVEIRFAQEREHLAAPLVDLLSCGAVPRRVIHYDTKINNVLIDDRSGEAACVIDLDTVMPGTALYDFGDAVRSGTSRCAEDESDLSQAGFDLELFEALARGYLEVASAFLTRAEQDHLVISSRLVTFATGLRFLTDHLAGDVYFKTHREQQNLDRCRRQFAMVRDMETRADSMQAAVDRALSG